MKTKQLLATLVLSSIVALLLVAAMGWLTRQRLLEATRQQSIVAELLRHHMQADMMHDALRGDVLASLLGARERKPEAIKEALDSYTEHADNFRSALAEASKLPVPAAMKTQLQKTQPDLENYIQAAAQVIDDNEKQVDSSEHYAAFLARFTALEGRMEELSDMILALDSDIHANSARTSDRLSILQAAAVALGLLLTVGMGTLISRRLFSQLGGEPKTAMEIAHQIAAGNIDIHVPVPAGYSHSVMGAMANMQQQLRERLHSERETARENQRIRTALDNSSTGVYIADPNLHIIYANSALETLLKSRGEDIRKAAPKFDPAKPLIGLDISILEPGHLQDGEIFQQLDRKSTAHREVQFGRATIAQEISAIRDASQRHIGFVCEWRDRTLEADIETEVGHVVGLAAAGDLSARVSMQGKHGFFLELAGQLNRLLEANAASTAEISRLLDSLAQGDLTVRMEGDFQGVFAKMRDDANATTEQLAAIVGRIQRAAAAIGTAAGEISKGNDDLSLRTERQSTSLEQTAASMEELTSTVKQNAEHARQANQLAAGAADVASRGGEVVGQVVTTMAGIEASSRKISEIVTVMDAIAFQTNILALNAAVEAARAGDQGRGFAVVASEVRTLALRSASSAKEIKQLIDDSVGRVADGSELVHRAGRTMDEVVASVQRVTDIMGEISAASQEQSAGIEQVNLTVTQMDESTQQNAALVEEATAAARSLEEQAGELADAVSLFRASPTGAATSATPRLVAPLARVGHA